LVKFPISRDPPEGGTVRRGSHDYPRAQKFPISRDPPEGGTALMAFAYIFPGKFPISRDPPEGGTSLSRRG